MLSQPLGSKNITAVLNVVEGWWIQIEEHMYLLWTTVYPVITRQKLFHLNLLNTISATRSKKQGKGHLHPMLSYNKRLWTWFTLKIFQKEDTAFKDKQRYLYACPLLGFSGCQWPLNFSWRATASLSTKRSTLLVSNLSPLFTSLFRKKTTAAISLLISHR